MDNLVVALVTIAAAAQAGALQTELPRPTDTRPRFSETLAVRGPGNVAQTVRVSLRDWVVRDHQTASLTTTGALVLQVRAGGPFTTVVDGRRAERTDDEFFAVPAGARLEVVTGSDTAVLTVLEVQP